MFKVIFVLVPSYSNNDWLNKKMMQITKDMVSVLNLENFPVHVVDSYNDVNKYLDEAEFIVVITAGNIVIHRDKLWKKITNIEKNVGLLAHILQFENDNTPYIHEQFFIINTKAVNNIDLSFDKKQDVGKKISRSEEDLHEGHSPLYVFLEKESIERTMQFGSNLIEQCLTNNYVVKNFDKEWRNPSYSNHYLGIEDLPLRGYCYPKKSTDIFARSLKDLKIYKGLDEAQEIFISIIKKALEYKVLNTWHYDFVPAEKKTFKHVIAPATGFLAEQIAYRTGAQKITFFDINKNNLDFKKYLYKYWDGKEYEKFFTQWAKNKSLTIEPNSGKDLESAAENKKDTEQTLFPIWNRWRENIEIEYIHDDLINSKTIIGSITDQSLIFTSTILNIYTFTSITHDKEDIEETKQQIRKAIKSTNSEWIEI